MYIRTKDYKQTIKDITLRYGDLILTKKQVAGKLVEHYGGDFEYHYNRIARVDIYSL